MSEWGKVPKEVFLDKRLTRRDLRVFGFVCSAADGKTGICRVKQSTIAEEIETDRVGVLRSLKKLVELGYLSTHQPAGMKRSLQYRVLIRETAGGQMSLFDGGEAPRQAKPTAKRSGRMATSERGRTATSVVAPKATSVVAPKATSIEQTLKNRTEPDGSAAAARTSIVPANDDRPDVADGEIDGHALYDTLIEVVGSHVNSAHPNIFAVPEPRAWLKHGCDLRLDVIPVLSWMVGRRSGSPIRSWKYFSEAVYEARDRRLAAATDPPKRQAASAPAAGAVTILTPHRPAALDHGGNRHGSSSFTARHERSGQRRRSHVEQYDDAFDAVFADVYRARDGEDS